MGVSVPEIWRRWSGSYPTKKPFNWTVHTYFPGFSPLLINHLIEQFTTTYRPEGLAPRPGVAAAAHLGCHEVYESVLLGGSFLGCASIGEEGHTNEDEEPIAERCGRWEVGVGDRR